jgi:dUTP pyrophosphatase
MKTFNLKFKKLHVDAQTPRRATPGSAGFDMVAISENIVNDPSKGYVEYGTGIALEIPDGYVGLCFPRSSVRQTGLILANCVGVIDSDYRGEIKFSFKYISGTAKYKVGDRCGQIVFVKHENVKLVESDELGDTERGDGGHGSTGV